MPRFEVKLDREVQPKLVVKPRRTTVYECPPRTVKPVKSSFKVRCIDVGPDRIPLKVTYKIKEFKGLLFWDGGEGPLKEYTPSGEVIAVRGEWVEVTHKLTFCHPGPNIPEGGRPILTAKISEGGPDAAKGEVGMWGTIEVEFL